MEALFLSFSALRELSFLRTLLWPTPVECTCEVPEALLAAEPVLGECRLLAELVGRSSQCVCQCDCHSHSEAVVGSGLTALLGRLAFVSVIAFTPGLLIGDSFGRCSWGASPVVNDTFVSLVEERVIVSRDWDIFEEDYAEADDLKRFLAKGQAPATACALSHYLVDHYRFDQDRQYYMDTEEALARGLSPAGAVVPVAAPPAAGASAGPAAKWCAMESRGSVGLGDVLTGSLGLVEFESNVRCTFKLKDMRLVDFGKSWEIEGPRSTYYTAERIYEGNHSSGQRHYWWRSVMGLSATDVGVDEYLLVSQLLEVGMTIDQMQVCNPATLELPSRRYQMWESADKDLLREVDTGGSGGDDWLSERSLLFGVKNLRSSAIVMLELEDYVAKELAARAALLKERRKGFREGFRAGRWCHPEAFSASQQMRQRDVLPISLAAASEVCAGGASGLGLSQSQRRRLRRRRAQEGWLFEGIRALNELGAPEPLATSPSSLTSAQISAVRHLARQCGSVVAPPPDCGSALGAWEALQGTRPGYADDAMAVGARANFERGNVSLPAGLSGRVALSECLPPALQSALEALAHLECEPHVIPVLHGGDVEVYYYQFTLPEQYRCYFGLPSLPIAHLSPDLVAALPDAARNRGWGARVVPMGWNWAVALVQAANQYQLDKVSPEAPWLLDKAPLPPLGDVGSLRGLYIDNFVSIAQSKSVATSDVESMQSQLAGLGIAATLETSEAGDNDFIGFTLVGASGEWRPKANRFWRLKLAADYLLEVRPAITGQELERFVGHVTALFSLSPELLCLMEKAPRPRALDHQEELEISEASEANILGLGRARSFAEVPAALVERSWTVACAGRWRGVPGSQVHLGARARTWTVRHVARDCSLHNTRVLLLGDNMSVICAHAKGRSSTLAMNFQCRLSSAIALAVGLKLHDRWAPSELNALDAASRGSGRLERLRAATRARLLLLVPLLTGLQQERIRPATQAGYCDVLEQLAGYLNQWPLPAWSGPQWALQLLDFVEWARGEGWSRALASRLLAAVVWAQPALGGSLRQAFPSAHAAMLGWRQLDPGHSRPPLPWGVVLALAWAMLPECPVGALAIIVMFETCLRPSELLSLTVGQLVPPATSRGQGAFWGFCVHVEELGRPSKTQEFDLSVLLDFDRHRPPIPLLQALQAGRACGERLFDVSSRQLYQSFALAVQQVKVSCVEPSLYALRHGGASHDRLVRARSLLEVQQREHGRSFRGVARYDKHARVPLQLGKLPATARSQIAALVDRGLTPFVERCVKLLHSRSPS
ncbi:unnamed protein product, partial [Prorocentrum cordatum]